jgi:hypothetical protein
MFLLLPFALGADAFEDGVDLEYSPAAVPEAIAIVVASALWLTFVLLTLVYSRSTCACRRRRRLDSRSAPESRVSLSLEYTALAT